MKGSIAIIGLLLLGVVAEAQAPPITGDVPDLFQDEANALMVNTSPPPPAGFGPDAEYDSGYDGPRVDPLAPTGGAPDAAHADGTSADYYWHAATLTPPPSLSFDIEALSNLPFGLESVDDPALLHFLEFYATEGRRRMSNWLARAGKYRPLLEPMLIANNAPPELFWIIAIESSFEPTAESSAGAEGLWQFMRHTGQSQGLRVDRVVDERRDPFASTRAAADYFNELYALFGSWPLAMSGYNAGHGHVRGQLREANATDFWELEDYGAVYTNARRYALRAMTLAIVDRNREAFGFENVVADPVWEFDIVEVPGGVRLALFADALDMNATELQVYNPALVGLRTPDDGQDWPLRIPPGTTDTFVANYDRLRSRYGEDHQFVTLRFGESIDDLGDAFDIPARVLRSINGIPYDAPSPYGAELMVPSRATRDTPSSPTERPVVLVPQTRFSFADRQRVFYRTKTRDQIAAIAHHFGVDPMELAAWNDLDVNGGLVSGLDLQVFIAPDFDLSNTVVRTEEQVHAVALNSAEWVALQEVEAAQQQVRRRYYTVRSGDTVMAIAARFGVRTADVVRWNELGDEAMIIVGQRLVVGR